MSHLRYEPVTRGFNSLYIWNKLFLHIQRRGFNWPPFMKGSYASALFVSIKISHFLLVTGNLLLSLVVLIGMTLSTICTTRTWRLSHPFIANNLCQASNCSFSADMWIKSITGHSMGKLPKTFEDGSDFFHFFYFRGICLVVVSDYGLCF